MTISFLFGIISCGNRDCKLMGKSKPRHFILPALFAIMNQLQYGRGDNTQVIRTFPPAEKTGRRNTMREAKLLNIIVSACIVILILGILIYLIPSFGSLQNPVAESAPTASNSAADMP